jgi:hypothetical protein
MTETTTKSAARRLTEAAGIADFPAADGWPPELLPGQLAGLMAGCRRKDDPKRYDVENRLIATGIKGGKLQTVTVLRPPSRADAFMAARRARVPGNSGWATNWDSDAPRRIERIPREVELREYQAIDRASCRTWLDAIEEPPGEYVRAWLGDECREEANGSAAPWSKATETGAGELATTAEVRAALALATGDKFDQFMRALGDVPLWIKSARRHPAGKSKRDGYFWNVAELAEAVTAHYGLKRKPVHAAIAGRWPNAAELFAL